MTDYKLVPLEPTPEMLNEPLQGGRFENRVDLRPSIYRAMLAAAPDVQGEPVGWQYYKYGKWWNGDNLTQDQRENFKKKGVRVRNVYAEPQLAEWTPAPDVAALVEALEQCITSMLDSGYRADAVVIRAARYALAAHRKQEGES